MEEGIAQLKKLPPWAWGLAIAGGLGLWWYSTHQASSSGGSGAGGQTVLPPAQGSINTSSPNCPSYPVPTCQNGQTITWSYDQQGCPMQVCTQNGGGTGTQSDQYVTTDGRTTFYSSSQVYKCWGETRIRFWVAAYGMHPELASTLDTTPLPAGIKLKVCGTFP